MNELDAIYYMVSSIFKFDVNSVICARCGCEHLDKDWFSVHPHQSHLCAGCGRTFRDRCVSVGNPISKLQAQSFTKKTKFRSAKNAIKIKQRDYPGGIQLWGSNPAILWTSDKPQQAGIHVHAFLDSGEEPAIDETFKRVEIDGFILDSEQIITLMAQMALPHIEGRIKAIVCESCGENQFDIGAAAFTPVLHRECTSCDRKINVRGRLRKIVANPMVRRLNEIANFAVRPPQIHKTGLLPETL